MVETPAQELQLEEHCEQTLPFEKYPKGQVEMHLLSYSNPVMQLVQSTMLLQVRQGEMHKEQILLMGSP